MVDVACPGARKQELESTLAALRVYRTHQVSRSLGPPAVVDRTRASWSTLVMWGRSKLWLIMLFWCGQSRAVTPAVIGKAAPTPSSISSFNITLGENGGIVAGNAVVIFTTNRNSTGSTSGANSFTISDTDGNTFWPVNTDLCYTQAQTANWGCAYEASGGRANIAWIIPSAKSSDTADVITVSWVTPASWAGGWAIQASGMAVDPWDGSANEAYSGVMSPQKWNAASGHPSNSSDLVLGFCASSVAVSARGGLTSLESSTTGYLIEYETGAGNASSGCTWSGLDFSIALETLTLRPAGTYPGIIRRQARSIGGSYAISCKIGITGTPGGSLIYTQGESAGDDSLSLTDSGSSTWSNLIALNGTTCSGGGACIAGYLANAPANRSWVEVRGSGGDNGSCSMVEYTGIARSSPLDQHGHSTPGTASPWSSPRVTTTSANEVLIGAFFGNPYSGPATPVLTGSWVTAAEPASRYNIDLIGEQIVSTTQLNIALTGTMTGTGTLYEESAIATFRAAPMAAFDLEEGQR